MASSGTIAVDLDKTLAEYTGWKGIENIGRPISTVVEYVQNLRKNGIRVVIFTARCQEGPEAIHYIEQWCLKHIGEVLPVTDRKTMDIVAFIDDRAVGVRPNTGTFLQTPPGLEEIRNYWNPSTAGAPPKEFNRG